MKKKIILILLIGILFIKFVFLKEKYSTITLDINPSIELKVNNKDIVIEIKALNEDAKELISNDLKNKNIDEVITNISNEIMDKIDNEDKEYIILLHVDGIIKTDRINGKITEVFDERQKKVNVIVPTITKKDEKEAKKLNITPAKAAFLKEVTESNDNLKIEELANKPVNELKEIKETGRYCDFGYTLEGDFCVKKIGEETAIKSKMCPKDYNEIDGTCYKTDGFNEELYCTNGQVLKDNKCVGEVYSEAKIKCEEGEYNLETEKCETLIYASEGTKKCGGDNPRISEQGTCTYPKPTINGGCIGNDVVINGWCYNMIDGGSDYPNLICPNGTEAAIGTNGRACYKKSVTEPTYYCNEEERLAGKKCISDKPTEPDHKIICNEGYTSYYDRMCVDYNNKTSLIDGYMCENKHARLEDNKCIIYEETEAKGR